MKMPEMSVVRFNESDVIVASPIAKTITLVRYGDSGEHASNNGYIKIDGVGYGVSQRHSLEQAYDMYDNFDLGTMFHWNRTNSEGTGSGNSTFSGILEFDNSTGGSRPGLDGVYYWRDGAFYDNQ